MKKNHFFIQALCLSMCLTSSTESDGEKVTFLFFLVVVAMNIALFFKIWGMTNDVAALRWKFAPKNEWQAVQDFPNGTRVVLKDFDTTGVVKGFNNGLYDVEADGHHYNLPYTSLSLAAE